MKNNQYGKMSTAFAVIILLFIVSLMLIAWQFLEIRESIRLQTSADTTRINKYNEYKEIRKNIEKLSNLTGFYYTSNNVKRANISSIIYFLDVVCSHDNILNSKQDLGLDLTDQCIDKNKVIEKQQPYDYSELASNVDFVKTLTNLEDVLKKCYERIGDLQKKEAELKEDLKKATDEYNYAAQEADNTITNMHQQIVDQRQEIEDAKKEHDQHVLKAEQDRDEAQQDKIKEKNNVLELTRQKREQEAKYKLEKETLEERIQELRAEATGATGMSKWLNKGNNAQKGQDMPDGEIIYSDLESETAYIDLGKGNGITKGMTFRVFSYGKGGEKVNKAKIIVKEVYDQTSKVGVFDLVDELNPVQEHDKILNPVYDKNKVKYFVIAGSLSQKYSLEQVTHRIEQLGGKIEKNISAKTDIVVLCDKFKKDKTYQLSLERGIETMLESEFIDYLDL